MRDINKNGIQGKEEKMKNNEAQEHPKYVYSKTFEL